MIIVYLFWMDVIFLALSGCALGKGTPGFVQWNSGVALTMWPQIHPMRAGLPTQMYPALVRTIILIVLVYFGYQTVISIRIWLKGGANVCRLRCSVRF